MVASSRLFKHIVVSSSLVSASSTPSDESTVDAIKGAYFGALVADALTLGSHYEYDSENIWNAYGGPQKNQLVSAYFAPGEKTGGATHGVGWGRMNYHPGQKKGDNTDYGEYNRLVLSYLAKYSGDEFENDTSEEHPVSKVPELISLWKSRMEETKPGSELFWGAWKCTQTKQALQKVQQIMKNASVTEASFNRLGGNSNAIALRSAPVFGAYRSEDSVATASKRFMFTHASSEAILGGEFFTRATHRLIYQDFHAGTPTVEDLISLFQAVAKQINQRFISDQVKKGVDKFRESTNPKSDLYKKSVELAKKQGGFAALKTDDLAVTSMARLWDVGKSEPIKVGKASPTEGVMPSSIYLVLKYWDLVYPSAGGKANGGSGKSTNSAISDFFPDAKAQAQLQKETAFSLAAKANVMVGGDNASRSVCVGMMLGALEGRFRGFAVAIPEQLKNSLNGWNKEEKKLEKLRIVSELLGVKNSKDEL